MLGQGKWRATERSARSGLVLLCGGSSLQRVAARARDEKLINGSDPVVVGDVESLLRCAPASRAVIVCGELAGMPADAVEQLVSRRAPQARLVRADRAAERARSGGRWRQRAMVRRLIRTAAVPH
jgi:hypothetical protein